MKTLQDFILESFNDSILTEYFKFAKSCKNSGDDLINSLKRGAERFDLHNGMPEASKDISNMSHQEIVDYLSETAKDNLSRYKTWQSLTNSSFFIFKITYNDSTSFGLCYLDTLGYALKDYTTFLPDSLSAEPGIKCYIKIATACTQLSNFIKKGANIVVYEYFMPGDKNYNELLQLRKKRKISKEGSFENTEEFCNYYKSETLKNILNKMIDNAKTKVPDYKKEFEEIKAEYEEIKSIASKLSKLRVSFDERKLNEIDSYFTRLLDIITNDPDLYNSRKSTGNNFMRDIIDLRNEINKFKDIMKRNINYRFTYKYERTWKA